MQLLRDEEDIEEELPDSDSIIASLSQRIKAKASGPRKKSRLKERAMNDSLWTRCNSCQRILYKQDILDNFSVCPACGFHFRISSTERLRLLFDDGRYELLDQGIYPVDFLNFEDSQKYSKRLEDTQARTGLSEAIQTGRGKMGDIPVLVLAMEFGFMGGVSPRSSAKRSPGPASWESGRGCRLSSSPVPAACGCRRA